MAINVARRNLSEQSNVSFYQAGVDDLPLEDGSMDFGYSLGVLHHIPDTSAAMSSCVKKLKLGAPFLVYLYYAFDNRPAWFRTVWKVSDFVRRIVARQPHGRRYILSQILAASVYWPLARTAMIAEGLGVNVENWPLSAYRGVSFYTMRTDALDRFGTQLEQRFTRLEIATMMRTSGLTDIRFSDQPAFWCAVGVKGD